MEQTESSQSSGMIGQLMGFKRPFWMVNIMEMFERLAYYGVRVVIPIYIAQADEIGGLHFSQIDKGIIFFVWALVQSLVPVFSGGFADRYGVDGQGNTVGFKPDFTGSAQGRECFVGHAPVVDRPAVERQGEVGKVRGGAVKLDFGS